MLYDRQIEMAIKIANPYPATDYSGTIEIKNLRISFSILKSISWSTNTASVRIWNLSDSNRKKLVNIGDQIRLSAGYASDIGPQLLFLGNTTQISHLYERPDVISVIDAGDGEIVLNRILISITFSAKTTIKAIIQTLADRMGLKIVTNAELNEIENTFYNNSFSFSGPIKDALDIVCKRLNLVWSVQNDNLVILKQNQGNIKPPYPINLATGMIGIPERFLDKRNRDYRNLPKAGWKVTTLLRPDIIPGDRIHLQSERADVNDIFYVVSVRHEGDNYGNVFQSQMELVKQNDNS